MGVVVETGALTGAPVPHRGANPTTWSGIGRSLREDRGPWIRSERDPSGRRLGRGPRGRRAPGPFAAGSGFVAGGPPLDVAGPRRMPRWRIALPLTAGAG